MLALFLALAAAPPGPAPPPEKWLVDWVDEAATPRFMADFHAQFAGSPHREDALRFEMTANCYQVSLLPKEQLEPVLVALRQRLEKGRETCVGQPRSSCNGTLERPLPQRARAAAALGCLRDAPSVEALARLAKHQDEALGRAALEALGFFGSRPSRALFLVFGGTLREVVFAPAPNAAATAALVEAFGTRPPLRHAALVALSSHDGPAVEKVLQTALAVKPPPDAAGADDDSLRTTALQAVGERRCTACVGWVLPLLTHDTFYTRMLAVRALGTLPEPAVIGPLIDRLGDSDASVREEAQLALLSLSGVRPPLNAAKLAQDDAPLLQAGWKRRFGEKGERYQPSLALRAREDVPGVY